jgi:small subunit ribosomal protein S1
MSVSTPSREDFAALLEESFAKTDLAEGYVAKGIVTAIEKDVAIVDVGLKVEGRIALKEFGAKAKDGTLKVGDEVEVYVERIENALGEAVLSREKARREESWIKLEAKFEAGERVEGVIFNQVKGGFTVDLDGAVAFLPRSQVDIRPIRDVTPLMHNPQPFEILKMDKRRGNIVVLTASSRTSPITVRSLTSAASTACCTSPTWHGAASTILRKSCPSASRSRFRSSVSTRKPTASRSA